VLPAKFRATFSPLETLTLAIFNVMTAQHYIAREHAANICSGADILLTRWSELRETVAERRSAGKDEIMFGRVMYPGTLAQGGGPKPVVGTLEEIAAGHPHAIAIIAYSVTRVANMVGNRAKDNRIDLDQFWAEPIPAPAVRTRPQKERSGP
jgi:hypothetical protein